MEMLQDGDRFYYLSRVQGLNMLNELEANSFSALVMRNSDLGENGSSHLPANLFQTPDHIFEVNRALQTEIDPKWGNPLKDLLTPLLTRRAATQDVTAMVRLTALTLNTPAMGMWCSVVLLVTIR